MTTEDPGLGNTALEPARLRVLLVGQESMGRRLRDVVSGGGSAEIELLDDVTQAATLAAAGSADVVLVDVSRNPLSLGPITGTGVPVIAVVQTDDDAAVARALTEGAAQVLRAEALADPLVVDLLRRTGEHHRALRALHASEARFQNIIEKTADGIVVVNHAGTVRFVNPAAERMFGREARELVGGNFGFPLVAGEDTEIDLIRRGGGSIVAELRVMETVWDGEAAWVVALRDVTDRKKAEERARTLIREQAARAEAEAGEQRWRFLAEAGELLASSLDHRSTLRAVARLAVPMLGEWCIVDVLEGAQLHPIAAVHADTARERVVRQMHRYAPRTWPAEHAASRAIQTGEPEVVMDISRGWLGLPEIPPEYAQLLRSLAPSAVLVAPMVAHGHTVGLITFCRSDPARRYGTAEIGMAMELARRAALAVENARLYQETQSANQAKAEFLAVMSHELRTPLNAILGYADLLLLGVPAELPDQLRRHVDRIAMAARHLLQIIDEILAFARLEGGREEVRPERVDVRELLTDAAAQLEPLARDKHLRLEVRLPDEPLEVEADVSKLRQIVANLLTNAIKFTDEGSVRLTADVVDDRIEIGVSDTGVGISEDHLDQIFDPFWQVDRGATRRAGGTGLGLTVSRRLARLLGGDVRAESRRGAGSRFTITLPRFPSAEA